MTGYSYDAAGNLTNDGLNALTYDSENRIVTSSGNLGSGTYSYDGKGIRVKKVSGSTTTVYILAGSKVIAEYENGAAPSSPTREYIYSGGMLLAKIESASTTYYHPDRLSNRLLTDSTGTTIGQQGHYPYGEQWYAQSTTTKWFFTTYERDAESGNDYAMARYYVNRLGRFSALDALAGDPGSPQSLNRFSYVTNDPINLTDSLGMCPENAVTFNGKMDCTNAHGATVAFGYSFDLTYAIWTSEGWATSPVMDQAFEVWFASIGDPLFWNFDAATAAAIAARGATNNGPKLILKAESDCPDPNGNGRNINYTLEDANGNPVSGYTVVEHQSDTSRASSAFGLGTTYQTSPPGTTSGFNDWLNPNPYQKPGNSIQTFYVTKANPGPNAPQQPVIIQSVDGQMYGSLGLYFQFPQVFVNGVPTPKECVFAQ